MLIRTKIRKNGFLRFVARVLLTGIPGRKRAEELEEEYVSGYEAKNGRRPRGNPKKGD